MEDKERTLYCGNLSDNVTEDLLYELFLQAGPLEGVTIPKDKDGNKRSFGFITFKHPVSVAYAVALMSGVSLFGRTLRLDARNRDPYNPYLEKLRDYADSAQRSRHDPSRRHGSRRYDPRANTDNRSDNMNLPFPQPQPVGYPIYNQQFVPNMNYQLPNPNMGLMYNQGAGMMPNDGWVRF